MRIPLASNLFLPMNVHIRPATFSDLENISAILQEAARWLEDRGMPLWRENELAPERIAGEVAAGLFVLAEVAGDAAATMMFQFSDPDFWPDVPPEESAFVHRLAVRRKYAGGQVSTALLDWAVGQTRRLGRRYLRLDCVADRPSLRAVYERYGFQHHSDWRIGPYHVARYEYEVNSWKFPRRGASSSEER
jgi:GNAT superfamily N-acetyltransferase